MKILLTGQTTLHWGRMEFGNIGNYYIIEPFIRELHKTFPGSEIFTTLQMSDRFIEEEKVKVLPMSLYYNWDNDKEKAEEEIKIVEKYLKTGKFGKTTPYIEAVKEADLIIDFSGDIWGDNANFLGNDRLYVGLLKNKIPQLLGKKNVMLAGSPGPFSNPKTFDLAKDVYKKFNLVTNRESLSRNILHKNGFDLSKTVDLACPAFLFEPKKQVSLHDIFNKVSIIDPQRKNVGFIVCGWNFLEGPFDKETRKDEEFDVFVEAVEYLNSLGANIFLMSHSNGFIPGKKPFKLIHGRDFPITKQLHDILKKRNNASNVYLLDGIYDAWTTKSIIGSFDMLVSGRVHGAVAGLSQYIPTVIIDYGHEPKAHKLRGFAIEAGAEEYVADPASKNDLITKINKCWYNLTTYQAQLKKTIPITKEKAKKNFSLLKTLFQ